MEFVAPGFTEMVARGKQFKELFGREVTMDDAPDWCQSPEERYAWAAGFHDGVLNFAEFTQAETSAKLPEVTGVD